MRWFNCNVVFLVGRLLLRLEAACLVYIGFGRRLASLGRQGTLVWRMEWYFVLQHELYLTRSASSRAYCD